MQRGADAGDGECGQTQDQHDADRDSDQHHDRPSVGEDQGQGEGIKTGGDVHDLALKLGAKGQPARREFHGGHDAQQQGNREDDQTEICGD